MTEQKAKGNVSEVSIAATVIRADGRREELGVISYWHKNPFRRALFAARQKLRSVKHGDIRR